MARYLLLAMNGPKSGAQEADYNAWYSHQLQKIAAIPGVASARRYKVVSAKTAQHPYLAAYEIDAEDIGACLREMDARLQPLDPPFDRTISELILAIAMD